MSMSMTNLVWALIVCAALLCALVEPSSSPPSMQNTYAAAAARTAAMYSYGQEAGMMDSDISRRILAGSNNNNHYISYGAISRDWVPCHVRGRSYYNCNTRQRSNPYTRGCTKITHCARNNH
ncbi:hypothetical protein ABFX02_13G029600 [Erythranthe guttata]